ncbi:MAG: vWA domain-containing protein [candidate division WOR-3 bacterium]
MVIFISLLLIGLLIFLYFKERIFSGFKLPLFLRILVLVFLILVLIGSVLRFSFTRQAKIPILVLVDASKSMSSSDNPQIIEQVISKIRQTNTRKKLFSFADSVGKHFDYQNPTGERTNIARALGFAQKQMPGAIVLISDGQHNYGSDPVNLAKSSTCPIYTIGIGREQKNDLSIEYLRYPLKCYQGDTIDIYARIRNQGFNNQLVKVSLFRKEQPIASQTVPLVQSNLLQEVDFKIVAETSGRLNYSLKIESLPDEESYLNNRKNFTIEALKSRWQILYFTNTPSYNTRFIISALNADKNLIVYPIISFMSNTTKSLTGQPLDKIFADADVLILDNISEAQLDNTIRNYLINWHKQSKGILVLVGESFKPQIFLNEISPFRFDKINISRKEYFFDLTVPGLTSTLFTTPTGTNILDNTPPLWGICVPSDIKPEAVVWAKSKPDSLPMIGYWKYKNSKIILVSAFPFWRIGFSAIETDRASQQFQNLLTNFMRFLAIKDVENFRLVTNKTSYLAGEEIVFNLIATTPDGKPWQGLDIKIPIPNTKISLPLYELSAGNYEGTFQAFSPGTYELEAQITQNNKPIGTVKTTLTINEQSVEDLVGLNSDLLQKIAQASNGRYYTPEEFLKETFAPQLAKYQRRFSLALSYNPIIYGLIAILFSIGLFLRKKRGLL